MILFYDKLMQKNGLRFCVFFFLMMIGKCVFCLQQKEEILNQLSLINENVNDVTTWTEMFINSSSSIPITALGVVNSEGISSIQYLSHCGENIYNDGLYSFSQKGRFRSAASVGEFVLFGTDERPGKLVPAGRIGGNFLSLLKDEDIVTAITGFKKENSYDNNNVAFFVATWQSPTKILQYDVNTATEALERRGIIKLDTNLSFVRAAVSNERYSYFASDEVPSKMVTINHVSSSAREVHALTLPCNSIRSGTMMSSGEYSLWVSHTSPICVCKVLHDLNTGISIVVNTFLIETKFLHATSIAANTLGQIVIGTKTYSRYEEKAAVIVLNDNGDNEMTLIEKLVLFGSDNDTVNVVRLSNEGIAYLINRNSPAQFQSFNLNKLTYYLETPTDEGDTLEFNGGADSLNSSCPVFVHGSSLVPNERVSFDIIPPFSTPLVLEIKPSFAIGTQNATIRSLQVGISATLDAGLRYLEIYLEVLIKDNEDGIFIPLFLGSDFETGEFVRGKELLNARFSTSSSYKNTYPRGFDQSSSSQLFDESTPWAFASSGTELSNILSQGLLEANELRLIKLVLRDTSNKEANSTNKITHWSVKVCTTTTTTA